MATDVPSSADDVATHVVLSHPSSLSDHAKRRIHQDYYRQYLRRAHDRVAVGNEWDEFTDIGCCGSQESFSLRVEAVEGGSRVTMDTTVAYQEREVEVEACDVNWDVQYE